MYFALFTQSHENSVSLHVLQYFWLHSMLFSGLFQLSKHPVVGHWNWKLLWKFFCHWHPIILLSSVIFLKIFMNTLIISLFWGAPLVALILCYDICSQADTYLLHTHISWRTQKTYKCVALISKETIVLLIIILIIFVSFWWCNKLPQSGFKQHTFITYSFVSPKSSIGINGLKPRNWQAAFLSAGSRG